MKKKLKQQVAIFCLTLLCILQANAEIKLPAVISDNMVLQQKSSVSLWGWAKMNSQVKLRTSWNGKSYAVQSDAAGYWRIQVATPEANYTPYSITISDGKAVVLKNILIGEVWLCSGQSNMEMPMKGFNNQPIEGGPEAIVFSRNPGIRCFTLERASTLTPQDHCIGSWETACPETVPNFTATGYYFARLINQALNVPVGLVHSSWGGSSIESWMTPASLKNIPEKHIPVTDADIKTLNKTPTTLYNGMIHPILGYGIRGAIWYQGEANRKEPDLYIKMFNNMVNEWRNLWGIGQFPFYFCQIAPYNYEEGINSAFIREAQAKGMEVPNTGMAVLMDAESPNCIHPPKKKDAGERMALWALAQTYGMKNIHYRSPEVKSLEMEGRVAVITFDYTGGTGLTSYGKEILNFQIAGKDKRFHKAKAALAGNKVYVFSPVVAEPVAVRYCFDCTSATEIFTVEGNLPLSSFRTDNW